MKKYFALALATVLAIPSLSSAGDIGTAFTSTAGSAITGTKTGGNAQSLGTLSSNVTLSVLWDQTVFTATTKHVNGTKEYGSSSGSTKIFNQDKTGTTPTVPTASDDTFFSGWTAM